MSTDKISTGIERILRQCSRMSLLFVEDDAIIRAEMVEMFEDIFSEVVVADDGMEGLEQYQAFYRRRQRYPSLVFTDMSMPRLSGLEMSKRIVEISPGQPIVVMTAHREEDIIIDFLGHGIAHVLFKPLNLDQLYRTLGTVSQSTR